MYTRVVRLETAADVSRVVAAQLLAKIIELQRTQDTVHLCLTGGNAANAMYEQFAELADGSALDASKLQLWWGNEHFVPTTDPARNSLQAISRLARTVSITSADTHMMAAKDGRKDSQESAAEYEEELGDTRFDITLLGIGNDGHVASIFPGHPSFDPTTSRAVIGVEDSPMAPSERISLTIPTLNRGAEMWIMATGEAKADAVQRSLDGDESIPAAHVRGRNATLWFLDAGASAGLPAQHTCTF
ncbi:6-phosphogluconolactonase [Tessaracoccus sp. ZS01]|uniref:6-phosphogluconolactonase n=1 Tax=Tessaracoccus sp. ZS01 TaxID=1906324 RepID=UPI00096D54FC|nr:6-phosphogluconolactonase [Tessaracoccus sp. ZS01]MCG6566217.1 6-phosphogluconolactonase [Tessaracoccus sp. ZS01]OMG58701.1 6-phosphogluconolactonase [Tessaracoccus sp. ZS01]